MNQIYTQILANKKKGKKLFSVLIDPDKFDFNVIALCNEHKVDYIMVGGSHITTGNFEKCVKNIKSKTKIPLVIFPGGHLQISKEADALLLLSLISGRNAEMLIGNHVKAAHSLKESTLEIISTGYMLIDSGTISSTQYMSNTMPIPSDKEDIAVSTAIAGELLGLKMMYLEAGSGSSKSVNSKMIKKVSENISVPLIVGGGINSASKAVEACSAGADVIIVGNAIEKDEKLIKQISKAIHSI